MEKETKKYEKSKEAHQIWDKFQNVHNKVYTVKLDLKSLLNVKEEIKSREMPLLLYKYCKQKGTQEAIKILKSNMIIINEDALIIHQSIKNAQAVLGLEEKTFEFPNL